MNMFRIIFPDQADDDGRYRGARLESLERATSLHLRIVFTLVLVLVALGLLVAFGPNWWSTLNAPLIAGICGASLVVLTFGTLAWLSRK